MLRYPTCQIAAQTNVKFGFGILKNVNAIGHRGSENMVAGAGFEPAIPPLRRDYEPDERCTPVR